MVKARHVTLVVSEEVQWEALDRCSKPSALARGPSTSLVYMSLAVVLLASSPHDRCLHTGHEQPHQLV